VSRRKAQIQQNEAHRRNSQLSSSLLNGLVGMRRSRKHTTLSLTTRRGKTCNGRSRARSNSASGLPGRVDLESILRDDELPPTLPAALHVLEPGVVSESGAFLPRFPSDGDAALGRKGLDDEKTISPPVVTAEQGPVGCNGCRRRSPDSSIRNPGAPGREPPVCHRGSGSGVRGGSADGRVATRARDDWPRLAARVRSGVCPLSSDRFGVVGMAQRVDDRPSCPRGVARDRVRGR